MWLGCWRHFSGDTVFKLAGRSFLQITVFSGLVAAGPVLLSLSLGALTHWLVDAVTHKDGSIMAQVPWLRVGVLQVGYRTVRVCQLLWHVSSLVGVV